MKLRTVDDLLFTGLVYTYDLEQQLTKALPRMVDASSSQELKRAFAVHAKETENHVKRLEQVFKLLDRKPEGRPNAVVKSMIEEAEGMIRNSDPGAVRDAALIVAGNQVEHLEMANYGSLRSYAELIGHKDVVLLLKQNLEEEKHADEQLTQIGELNVNRQAALAKAAA